MICKYYLNIKKIISRCVTFIKLTTWLMDVFRFVYQLIKMNLRYYTKYIHGFEIISSSQEKLQFSIVSKSNVNDRWSVEGNDRESMVVNDIKNVFLYFQIYPSIKFKQIHCKHIWAIKQFIWSNLSAKIIVEKPVRAAWRTLCHTTYHTSFGIQCNTSKTRFGFHHKSTNN